MANQKVLNFIKQQELAVISTVNSAGKAESAVIGFGETDKFELIFGTYDSSRKYQNLRTNQNVSFVIGWTEGKTVQYEGIAEELTGQNRVKYADLYFSKNPDARKYQDNPEERYFKVNPKWVRYTDLSFEPWEVIILDKFSK